MLSHDSGLGLNAEAEELVLLAEYELIVRIALYLSNKPLTIVRLVMNYSDCQWCKKINANALLRKAFEVAAS